MTALIALIIIIIWLVVFAFLIKLDVGGIGSNVLYPVLKDVPLVNKILPSVSEEQQAEEGNYKYTTLKSANARIEELEGQLASRIRNDQCKFGLYQKSGGEGQTAAEV